MLRWAPAFICAAIVSSFAAAQAVGQRPFTVDDLFELEDIVGGFGRCCEFSPDGVRLAFVRVRAVKSEYRRQTAIAGTEVWLQPAFGQEPMRLARDIQDLDANWAPQWSPRGSRLAMLAQRHGDADAHLLVWESDTGALREIDTRGVYWTSLLAKPIRWISEDELLVPVLNTDAQHPSLGLDTAPTRLAPPLWQKALGGMESTASVLGSGTAQVTPRPEAGLAIVDVRTGTSRVLSDDYADGLLPSPAATAVAFLRTSKTVQPQVDDELDLETPQRLTVQVRSLRGDLIFDGAPSISDVARGSLRWSKGGDELAFIAYDSGRAAPPTLCRLTIATRHLRRIVLDPLKIGLDHGGHRSVALEWTAQGDLVVRARAGKSLEKARRGERQDWWRVTPGKSPTCLTCGLPAAPVQLIGSASRRSFFGIAAGDLWRIRPAAIGRDRLVNITADLEPSLIAIHGDTSADLALIAADQTIYHWSEADSEISELSMPSADSRLVALGPTTGAAAYLAKNRNGIALHRLGPAGLQLVVELNGFLRNVAEAQRRSFEYVSLNGRKLVANLLLPPDFRADQRYPLLTWVYAGDMQTPGNDVVDSIGSSVWLNLQIAAAHGYAVLLPSMPLKPFGEADDPLLRLTEGVIPALDETIDLGIADPDRLFLMGQSNGGYSTYGLITQTNRFKAAIAIAGFTDALSNYGTFDMRRRYSDDQMMAYWSPALAEAGQAHMRNPPWKDLGRYLRNSPIAYVERVQTPLLMMHGDLDLLSMQQAEEFFTALYRQGKTAQLVRYWGEGHIFASPANIRDMWERIFGWFDRFDEKGGAHDEASVAQFH